VINTMKLLQTWTKFIPSTKTLLSYCQNEEMVVDKYSIRFAYRRGEAASVTDCLSHMGRGLGKQQQQNKGKETRQENDTSVIEKSHYVVE